MSSACLEFASADPREGDIVFQTSLSSQSEAIQRATHSAYSHVGVVLERNSKLFVLEAVDTVRFTPLQEWLDRGQDHRYVIKRLRAAESRLTPTVLSHMRESARGYLGRQYDWYFQWSDDRLYCSELVWKIFSQGAAVQLGHLQKLSSFELNDPLVKSKLRERFGSHIPMDEPVIPPSTIFQSSELITVEQH